MIIPELIAINSIFARILYLENTLFKDFFS